MREQTIINFLRAHPLIAIRRLEVEAGMPERSLSKALAGADGRGIPDKYLDALENILLAYGSWPYSYSGTLLSFVVPTYAQDRLKKKIDTLIQKDVTAFRSPDADKMFCLYCGLWLVYPARLTLEHIVPRSKGGNNSKHNTRPCCDYCNGWRGNKSFSYWKSEIEELLNERRTRVPYSTERLRSIISNIEAIESELQQQPHLFLKTNSKQRELKKPR